MQQERRQLEAALWPYLRRVRGRWLVEWGRAGLVWGLAAAALPLAAARLLPWGSPGPGLAAALALLLSPAGALFLALRRLPGRREAALAADSLGLAEQVSSALYAAAAAAPAAPLLARAAVERLSGTDPARYPVVAGWRRWQGVPLLAGVLVALLLLPSPGQRLAVARRQERQALDQARVTVQALAAQFPESAAVAIPQATAAAATLAELEAALAAAPDLSAGRAALAAAQQDLAGLAAPEDAAWEQSLAGLAAAWQDQSALADLGAALGRRDPAAVAAAVQDLAAAATVADAAEREAVALALQAGANAALGVPELAETLRRAAREVASAGGGRAGTAASGDAAGNDSGGAASGEAGGDAAAGAGVQAAFSDLRRLLAAGAGRAAGWQGLQQQMRGLAALAEGMGAGTGGTGAGGGSGAGTGTGAGAGLGGDPSSRGPGAGTPTGGAAGAPTTPPTLRPALDYLPRGPGQLLGGSGQQVAGLRDSPAAAGDEVVTVPESPLTAGELHPWSEVYGQYAAEARRTLAQTPLPPSLQELVQRYFSNLDPASQTAP